METDNVYDAYSMPLPPVEETHVPVARTATGTTRLPRAQRHQQILTVSAGEFAARGFAAVTMDEIARVVGVSRLILYRYFASKEELYLAVLLATAERLANAMETATSDPGATGSAPLRAYITTAREDIPAFALLFAEGTDGPMNEAVATAQARVRVDIEQQALSQAMKGGVAPDAIWLKLVGTIALAIVERGTLAWLQSVPHPASAADDAFIEYLQRAVSGMLLGIAAGRFALRFPPDKVYARVVDAL